MLAKIIPKKSARERPNEKVMTSVTSGEMLAALPLLSVSAVS